MARRIVAEGLGSAFLLMAVVGSGIMGERLAAGNVAIALLANTIATGAALTVLISIFGPISGAHFNPAVSLVFMLKRELPLPVGVTYIATQIVSAIAGVYVAHLMFARPVFEIATKLRDGPAQGFSEFVATFGLVLTILGAVRFRPDRVAILVGLYITSAYWFTASTSFANPAVTIARALSDSFAGIAPTCAPQFVAAQIVGAIAAYFSSNWLFDARSPA